MKVRAAYTSLQPFHNHNSYNHSQCKTNMMKHLQYMFFLLRWINRSRCLGFLVLCDCCSIEFDGGIIISLSEMWIMHFFFLAYAQNKCMFTGKMYHWMWCEINLSCKCQIKVCHLSSHDSMPWFGNLTTLQLEEIKQKNTITVSQCGFIHIMLYYR